MGKAILDFLPHIFFWMGTINLGLDFVASLDKKSDAKPGHLAVTATFFLAAAVLKYITSG